MTARPFLTQRLNETSVYPDPGIYFINTQGEDWEEVATGAVALI